MDVLKVPHSVPILHSSIAHYSDFGAQWTVQPFSNPILWPWPTSMHQIMIILEKFWNWA